MSNKKIKAPSPQILGIIDDAVKLIQDKKQVPFQDLYTHFGLQHQRSQIAFRVALRDFKDVNVKTGGGSKTIFAYVGELPPEQQSLALRGSATTKIDDRLFSRWCNECEELIVKTYKRFRTCGTSSNALKALCEKITAFEWDKVSAELRNRGLITENVGSRIWTVGPNHPAFQETSND